MSCINPFGDTNARRCENVHPRTFQPFTLPYLRATANVLVDGPEEIMVRDTNDPSELAFERIIQVLLRTPNQRVESWAVFRQEREWAESPTNPSRAILRYCSWDTKADLEQRCWERGEGPTVSLNTRIISATGSELLRPRVEALDRAIISGISLQVRSREEYPPWQEISIWRAKDWGKVDYTWIVGQQSATIEPAALDLAALVDQILVQATNERIEVASFRMVYACTPYLVLS